MPKLHTRTYPDHIKFPLLEDIAHLAPFIAGEACPHCRVGDLIPDADNRLVCELPHCQEAVPESFYIGIPNPEPIADGKTYVLEGFPDYEFDSLGTPTRVTARSKGPKPKLGPVEPVRTSKSSRYYALAGRDSRIVITDKKLQTLIVGKKEFPKGWFELDEFPRNYFDENGRAFSKVGGQVPCRYVSSMKDNVEIRRYKLYHGPTGDYKYITDHGARQIDQGRCTYDGADIDESSQKSMGSEFPDFCADYITGQPYRISGKRYKVYTPQKCKPRQSDGKFYIYNFEGHRQLLSSNQILDIIGSIYYIPPTPEKVDTSVSDILADIARKTQEERKELLGR